MIKALIGDLYRRFIPNYVRRFRASLIDRYRKKVVGKAIRNYYFDGENIDEEIKNILNFIENEGIEIFPYNFIRKYNKNNVHVYSDHILGMKYTILDNKKVYYPKNMSKSEIKKYFNAVILEQDQESPHRYLTEHFNVDTNDIVIDIGAAEGNFSISIVENVGKLYIFEADKRWVEALKATFEPWKDKVEIIQKYVSSKNDRHNVSLDVFFQNYKTVINFIKADVEGYEGDILNGATRILAENKDLKIAICTYHKQNDAVELSEILKKFKFNITFSEGYMIFYGDKEIQQPYFRRTLIRARK